MESAAKRLQHALLKADRAALMRVVKAAGVDIADVGKAFKARPVPTVAYIRLCALCAIDFLTGEPTAHAPYPQRMAWPGFAERVRARLRNQRITLQEASNASKVSKTVLSDASRGTPIGPDSFIAICSWLECDPRAFLSFAVDVSQETCRRNCGEAPQSEVRP